MKIGIIGYGFVGKALEAGLKDNVQVIKIDPKLNTKIEDLADFNPDALFVCVPTPMEDDSTQNISILMSVLEAIKISNTNSLIAIKSTVLPNHIQDIESIFPDFVYNPEFLREDYAAEDFISSDLIIFGGKKDPSISLSEIYNNYTKCICKNYVFTDHTSASLIKYTINSFLATKVTFFNELNALFKKSGTDESWDNFINAISRDKRIGNSHMQVPGHDGRYGFGGACLPKDSKAFSIYANNKNIKLNILNTAINTNNSIRASYNTKTDRELEQNIKFEGDK